ncbi:hypothetical protein SDC9_86560 [bioreactor metagenome]|uniref:DUF2154 domain-containing protein n=1 Tax=bioreactor metagenome TaxID=1076179 RepID=A0A644ZQQ0_9ZZZZ
MSTKQAPKTKSNVLIVVAIITGVVVLVLGVKLSMRILLPKLVNKVVDTAVDTSFSTLDFDNAATFPVSQSLTQNEGMILQMSLNKGKIFLDENSQSNSLLGEVAYLGAKPLYDYQTNQDKVALFSIKSTDQVGDSVALHLSDKTMTRVDIALGAGSVDADFSNLDVPLLNVSVGAGVVTIKFPKDHSVMANLSSGVGKLNLMIYEGSGVRVILGQDSADMSFGDAYEKVEGGYQTKGYDEAKVKIELTLGQALGGFSIQGIE